MTWLFQIILRIWLLCALLIALACIAAQNLADGNVLAYTRIDDNHDPHVLLLDAGSGLAFEITPPDVEGRAPRWTPDGNRITFPTVRNRDERGILEVNLPTLQSRNLTELWGYESIPIYSPIDNRILFPLLPNTTNMPLFVVDGNQPESEPEIILPRIQRDVAWSPDGLSLAYITMPEQEEGEITSGITTPLTPALFTINLETGVTTNWTGGLPSAAAPIWSPDSKYIVFATGLSVNNLFIINTETGITTPLRTTVTAAQSPVWSPDSRYLVVAARMNNEFDIFMIEVETGAARNLSQSPSYDASPTWSADGRYIAYVSHRSGQNDIYVVNIQNGRTRRLTYTPEAETEVTWQPR